MLAKSVKTIVDQVDAMKRLVNEFRDYARLPAADLKPVDLNALVADVLHLYAAETAPRSRCVPNSTSAARRSAATRQQIRQVIHNLLQNAQDAAEAAAHGHRCAPAEVGRSAPGSPNRASACASRCRTAAPGFAENILKRAFEPYVTTKTKGTGLGLAVVKKIADEHGARIETFQSHRRTGLWLGHKSRYHSRWQASRRERPLTPKSRSRPSPERRMRGEVAGQRTHYTAHNTSIHGKHPRGRRRAGHPGPALRNSQ